MRCECCGEWRIDTALLDGVPRLKLTHHGYLVGGGYFTDVDQLFAVVARYGGPDRARFRREAA
ncbi:hypothetical protein [Cryptosporangium phraense]|uniref:Uncharacterized protein n=1 Tax=Cryptosporangium phraense TaxID=2593070 RepID=A0A545AIH1_9ACTN|nr:hypothetical protein [Cryptosporangium phraense]TQS41113.1 hypothetical protein FL583_31650 [Cryptosporangium phraense]